MQIDKNEVINKQRQSTLEQKAVHELHLEFQKTELERMKAEQPKPKNKDEAESQKQALAQFKMHQIHPLEDKIALNDRYLAFLDKCES